jgi:hypothetical protein
MPRLIVLLALTGCTNLEVVFDDADTTVSGALSVSPSTLDFGTLLTSQGEPSAQTVTIEDVGDGPLAIGTSITSAFKGAYTLTLADQAPQAGESTTLTVTLSPADPGDHAATLIITDDAGTGHVEIPIAAFVQLDNDGDGFGSGATGGTDCDDGDPSINPDADDAWYDGVDSDCAGNDDYDQDADGVTVDTDCDDTLADVYPGAVDAWYDGVDSDCAGNDDYDQDTDGVDLADDCDDTDGSIHPGAADAWYDGIDADCAGNDDYDQDADGVDLGDDCRDDDATIHPGAPDAWYDGVDSDCAGNDDFDQDADGVSVTSDCDDTDATIGAPTTETWDRVDNDCDGTIDDLAVNDVADGILYGDTASLALGASHTLSLGGDIDDDGADDIIALSATGSAGAGWVVPGVAAIGVVGAITGYDTASLSGEGYYPLGYVAGPMADLTGDGRADVLVAGSYATYYYGRAWMLDASHASGAQSLGTGYTARFAGDSNYDLLRWAIPGDIDGDGVNEVVTGAVYDSYSSGWSTYDYYTGNVAVFSAASFAGAYDLGDADDEIAGDDDNDNLGASLAVGDVNGDGYADILAGAPGNDDGATNAGAVYVFVGGSTSWASDRAGDAAYTTFYGTTASGMVGNEPIPTPGDLDGDGAGDVALAASNLGSVWVFYDLIGRYGDVAVSSADASFTGPANSFGSAVAIASDLDADGATDLAIGASGDDTSATNAGAVYLYAGGGTWTAGMTSADADASLHGAANGDALGAGLAAGGDVDEDGNDDLLVGATGSDGVATNGGAVYLLLGR